MKKTMLHQTIIATKKKRKDNTDEDVNNFIEGKVTSNTIIVHKSWRTAFFILYVVSKFFLLCLIYYITQYHRSNANLEQLQKKIDSGKITVHEK